MVTLLDLNLIGISILIKEVVLVKIWNGEIKSRINVIRYVLELLPIPVWELAILMRMEPILFGQKCNGAYFIHPLSQSFL